MRRSEAFCSPRIPWRQVLLFFFPPPLHHEGQSFMLDPCERGPFPSPHFLLASPRPSVCSRFRFFLIFSCSNFCPGCPRSQDKLFHVFWIIVMIQSLVRTSKRPVDLQPLTGFLPLFPDLWASTTSSQDPFPICPPFFCLGTGCLSGGPVISKFSCLPASPSRSPPSLHIPSVCSRDSA